MGKLKVWRSNPARPSGRLQAIKGGFDYYLLLCVLLILVMLHRSIAPWLNLTNGEAFAIGLALVVIANIIGLLGFLRLLKDKFFSRTKRPKS
jgi:F0F1-type ATP synthase assembly protein I